MKLKVFETPKQQRIVFENKINIIASGVSSRRTEPAQQRKINKSNPADRIEANRIVKRSTQQNIRKNSNRKPEKKSGKFSGKK